MWDSAFYAGKYIFFKSGVLFDAEVFNIFANFLSIKTEFAFIKVYKRKGFRHLRVL